MKSLDESKFLISFEMEEKTLETYDLSLMVKEKDIEYQVCILFIILIAVPSFDDWNFFFFREIFSILRITHFRVDGCLFSVVYFQAILSKSHFYFASVVMTSLPFIELIYGVHCWIYIGMLRNVS